MAMNGETLFMGIQRALVCGFIYMDCLNSNNVIIEATFIIEFVNTSDLRLRKTVAMRF